MLSHRHARKLNMKKKQKHHLIKTISGIKKLVFCFGLSIIAFSLLTLSELVLSSRIMLAWDTFCISMIIISWTLFFSTPEEDMCNVVENQDDGAKATFIIVLIAVCISLFGTVILIIGKNESNFNKIVHTIISMSQVLLSWLLLHTMFAIRYAHLYHDHKKYKNESKVDGLGFPSYTIPDYIDFAYFSFVIGMTFQVSDISVNVRSMRRFVLMHSLISFVYNTIIVALTINAIAGFSK